MSEKMLPHSEEAERSVLGCILLSNGKLYHQAASLLEPDDFFYSSHKAIFEIMGSIEGPIDLVTLTEALLSKRALQKIGGAGFVSDLTSGLPMLENIEYYAGLIKEKASLRKLINGANLTLSKALAGDGKAEDIAAEAQTFIASESANGTQKLQSIGDIIKNRFTSLDNIAEEFTASGGIETGFSRLDSMIGGLRDSEFIVLAARPGNGKTALGLNIAVNFARKEIPVAFFSIEMSQEAIMTRLICSEAQVALHKVQAGFCSREDKVNLAHAALRLGAIPLYLDAQSNQRPETIYAKAKAFKEKAGGLGLVVIDYLQLINPGAGHDSRVQEVSYISRSLKRISKDLNIPVLCIAQLNRAPEERGGAPKLSDLRDSGQIEQDADIVMFLWKEQRHPGRDDIDTRNIVNLTIAKQRNGPTGQISLLFLDRFVKFVNLVEDIEGEEQEEMWEE